MLRPGDCSASFRKGASHLLWAKPEVTTQVLFEAMLGPEPSQVLTPGAALQGTEPAAGHGAEISVTGQAGRQSSSSLTAGRAERACRRVRAGPRAAL